LNNVRVIACQWKEVTYFSS